MAARFASDLGSLLLLFKILASSTRFRLSCSRVTALHANVNARTFRVTLESSGSAKMKLLLITIVMCRLFSLSVFIFTCRSYFVVWIASFLYRWSFHKFRDSSVLLFFGSFLSRSFLYC